MNSSFTTVFAEMGRSSDEVNEKFRGENLNDLMNRLNTTIKNNELIKVEKIEPLSKILLESARNRGIRTVNLDRNITNAREKYTLSKAALNSYTENKKSFVHRLSVINQHMSSMSLNYSAAVSAAYNDLFIPNDSLDSNQKSTTIPLPLNIKCIEKGIPISCSDPFGNLLDVSNVQYLQALQDLSLSNLASVNVSVTTNEKSLKNLLTVNSDDNSNLRDNKLKLCEIHTLEQCPTCGQELSSNQLHLREIELRNILVTQQIELKSLQIKNTDIKRRYDLSVRAKSIYDQWYGLQDRKKELLIDINNNDELIRNIENDEKNHENELNAILIEKTKIQNEDSMKENLVTAQIEEAESNLKNSVILELKLRTDVEEVRGVIFLKILLFYFTLVSFSFFYFFHFSLLLLQLSFQISVVHINISVRVFSSIVLSHIMS